MTLLPCKIRMLKTGVPVADEPYAYKPSIDVFYDEFV